MRAEPDLEAPTTRGPSCHMNALSWRVPGDTRNPSGVRVIPAPRRGRGVLDQITTAITRQAVAMQRD